MNNQQSGYKFRRAAVALTAMGGILSAMPASAEEFKFGDSTLTIDSIASVGISLRASGQDCMYISAPNGGCTDGIGQYANVNLDNGNVNFEQWDPVSAVAKIISDIEFRKDNWGAFARVKASYDYIITEEAGENTTRFGRIPLNDDSKHGGRSIDLLDAFVFANFDLGSVPTTVRVGKQVINWGESLVIQGGINQFNSIDVGAIRTPGAELKEALLPEESVYVNLALPYDMSFEAFYAFNWRRTELDPVGSFFSGADFFGRGSTYISTAGLGATDSITDPNAIPVAPGQMADDQGQFGVKLGHWASWLNDGTELALYYVNYHSKLPYLEYSNGFSPAIAAAFLLPPGAFPAQFYREVYPEDVKYVGTSFATTIEGIAVSGEALYSWNMPLQISSGEILAGRWAGNLGLPGNVLPYDSTSGAFPAGYFREDVINGQLTAIDIENPSSPITSFFRADLTTLIANWGFQHLPNISDDRLSVTNAGRGSEISHPIDILGIFNPAQPLVHADSFSHGYRLIGIVDYNNAFGTPWKLSPSIQWAHDLKSSAGTIGPGFLKDRKTVSVGVTADLQNTWKAELRYTNSFGNKFQNYTQDRDFISASVSYAF